MKKHSFFIRITLLFLLIIAVWYFWYHYIDHNNGNTLEYVSNSFANFLSIIASTLVGIPVGLYMDRKIKGIGQWEKEIENKKQEKIILKGIKEELGCNVINHPRNRDINESMSIKTESWEIYKNINSFLIKDLVLLESLGNIYYLLNNVQSCRDFMMKRKLTPLVFTTTGQSTYPSELQTYYIPAINNFHDAYGNIIHLIDIRLGELQEQTSEK